MKITKIVTLAVIGFGIAATSFGDELKLTFSNGHYLYRRVQEASTVAVYPNHIMNQRPSENGPLVFTVANGHALYRRVQ